MNALNYNPNATTDNNSCLYDPYEWIQSTKQAFYVIDSLLAMPCTNINDTETCEMPVQVELNISDTSSSYIVAAEALKALSIIDLEAAYTIAKKELNTAKKELLNIVFYVIAKNGLSEDAKIIQTEFDNAEGYEIIEACIHLVEFSKKQKAQK